MAQSQIISENLEFNNISGNRIRLNPWGGRLAVQKYISGMWITAGDWGILGSPINNFRFIAEDDKLKLQQLRIGGTWEGGGEGVDFDTVAEWNKL